MDLKEERVFKLWKADSMEVRANIDVECYQEGRKVLKQNLVILKYKSVVCVIELLFNQILNNINSFYKHTKLFVHSFRKLSVSCRTQDATISNET